MNRIQYPPVYAGLGVLLITSICAVVGARPSPATFPAMLFWASLYGSGLICGWKFNQSRSEIFKNVTNVIAAIVLLLFIVMVLFSSFEQAFVLLLIGLQAARNFTLATRKDFYYSYVISLILILYGASLSKETLFIAYIVLYVLAGMFTLMADHIDDTLSRAQGGDREILVRKMSLPVKGTGLAFAVLGLSVLLYFVVPRPPSPRVQAFPSGGGWTYRNDNWEREAKQDEQRTSLRPDNLDTRNGLQEQPNDQADAEKGDTAQYGGFQKNFDITKGCSALPDSLLFYVQADRPLYARAKAFDLFDGRTWSSNWPYGRKIRNKDGFALDKEFRGYGTGQTFSIEAEIPPYLPAAYRPVMVWFPGGVLHQESDYTLRAPASLKKGTIYSVLSESGEVNGRPVSRGEEAGNLQRYLQLPQNISLRVRELGGMITRNIEGPLAKAEAIESYLRSNYFYTMNTALKHPDSDVIDEFLFETKQGHCEYFASSMILMLRAVNIPARLATGYAVYEKNVFTGYYEVRQKNSHAWVEAYIGGYGWMTFEPTSPFEIPRASEGIFAASDVFAFAEGRLSQAVQSNQGTWWAELLRKIVEFFKRTWRLLKELFAALWSLGSGLVAWLMAGGWLVVLLVLAGAGITYLALNRLVALGEKIDLVQLKKKDQRQFILQCYREMEKILSRKKLPRQPFCAPSEYRPVIAARLPHLALPIDAMTGLFNLARYSSIPIGPGEADRAFEAYRDILKHIDKKPEKG